MAAPHSWILWPSWKQLKRGGVLWPAFWTFIMFVPFIHTDSVTWFYMKPEVFHYTYLPLPRTRLLLKIMTCRLWICLFFSQVFVKRVQWVCAQVNHCWQAYLVLLWFILLYFSDAAVFTSWGSVQPSRRKEVYWYHFSNNEVKLVHFVLLGHILVKLTIF